MFVGSNLQSANEIYSKLNQNYAKLDSLEKDDVVEKFNKDDYNRVSSNENYDEKDYERVLSRYKQSDAQIRQHEQSHASSSIASTPDYDYQVGPDGKLYATGGEVRIDTSIPNDEKAAAFKLDQMQDSSSAPNELSSADAQISRTANLNKLLLQSLQGEENAS